jgi:hypothetical protein
MLLAIAPASAQTCNAPPGTAAVDQYCENVPSAGGDGGGPSGGSSAKPSQSTVHAFAGSGRAGKELNKYLGEDVASTGGSKSNSNRSSGSRKKSQKDQSATKTPRQPSASPLGAVQSAVNSGATIGGGFTWILIAIALVIGGTAWLRHRGRST